MSGPALDPQFGCGTNLDGRFWTHSSATRGSTLNPAQSQPWTGFVPATTGFHPKSGAPSIDDLHVA